jgi:hypothetical protein
MNGNQDAGGPGDSLCHRIRAVILPGRVTLAEGFCVRVDWPAGDHHFAGTLYRSHVARPRVG